MAKGHKSHSCLDFVSRLLTAIRTASLYSPRHPEAVSAIRNAYKSLCQTLHIRNTITLGLSEDNEILIDDQPLSSLNIRLFDFFINCFKALEIASFLFHSGITEKEFQNFIGILSLKPDEVKRHGDMKRIFLNKNIQHIEVDLFSYAKVKKDEVLKPKIKPSGQEKIKYTKEEFERLKKENEELHMKVENLMQQINSKDVLLKILDTKNTRLTEAKERTDSIVRNMSEGLIVVGSDGKILMANSTAKTLLGIGSDDVGKSIKKVIKNEHLLTLARSLSVKKEGVVEEDIELFSQNELTKKVLRTSSAVVEDHDGRTVGMVTILNDVTKQKEIEKLKSEFLANVTHELRTPLVAIDKSILLLTSKTAGPISQEEQEYISIAERNLKRLSQLINDLLDLSKLEVGKMVIRPKPISMEEIVNGSIASLGAWVETKSIKVEKKLQENLPQINADPDRISQVLVNLIGNAIKFTPRNGNIIVKAILRKEEKEIEVSVQDTGIGITKEELPNVFDKFYQSTRSGVSCESSGTGIGLSIAKEIVELHGGKIWVESTEGQGATFAFTFAFTLKGT